MKKFYIVLNCLLLAFPLYGSSGNDGFPPLSFWFDAPNTLQGKALWDNPNHDLSVANRDWETKSLPIGNGNIGANILGSVEAERITFNEKSLWLGGPNTSAGPAAYWNVNKQSASVLADIRKAFQEGNQAKAERLTCKNFNSGVEYESWKENPFRYGHYTTMGEFYVETGLSTIGMTHYKRELSLDSAMVHVKFRKDGVNYQRTSFVSYPANMLVMRYSADTSSKQNLVFSYASNPLAVGGFSKGDSNELVYRGRLKNNDMAFVFRVKVLHKGGHLKVTNDKFIIRDADSVTFLVTADTDYKQNFDPDFSDPKTYVGIDPEYTTAQWMQKASARSYEELLAEHYEDYASLFQRVRIQLGENDFRDMPITQRLANYRKGKPDTYLEELYYQFGRYLLIASSRPGNLPANLQGMWHNLLDGPWRIDYHNNINLQMNYWPACSTNLSECTWPLIDFIRSLVKPGEKTAQAYYGARGWTTSVSSNIFGFTTPLASESMLWNLCPVAGPWLSTHIWEYYDYTRDLAFLKEYGYELIKSSADFAVDYLWHKDDGSYTAAPSTSPEHGPVDQGATFVHAVIREILLTAIEASRLLNVDRKERKVWRHVLEHLVPYRIGRYGQLMEWYDDIDDPEDKHRHVNHLFGLHPGHTISPVETPELAEASRVVLNHRGDGATGWSMGWKLNQWARLHDGNRAYTLFGNLIKNGTLDNLWDNHPPFQIDGNFGGTAGVTEMLLQSHMGFIHLLPALPNAWKQGTVTGLCARGNFKLDLYWQQGDLQKALLKSNSGGSCTLRYKEAKLTFQTQKGKSYLVRYRDGKLIASLNK